MRKFLIAVLCLASILALASAEDTKTPRERKAKAVLALSKDSPPTVAEALELAKDAKKPLCVYVNTDAEPIKGALSCYVERYSDDTPADPTAPRVLVMKYGDNGALYLHKTYPAAKKSSVSGYVSTIVSPPRIDWLPGK